ncbi:MAG TPA: hypothetical protein PKC49_02885 [Phycisphaerae bacterium]|nr:hypothetical protein [Phycisphaerae bacterium]
MLGRRTWLTGLLLSAWAACAAAAHAQEFPDGGRQRARIPSEGFWPTRVMMDRGIDRLTEELAKQYEFDEDQLARTRELLKERFPRFLEDNRAEIQTLMNQFFEAQLRGEPPTPEVVADWSQRALPLFNQFSQLARDTADDMREFLTDDQAVRLEGNIAAFNAGAAMVNNRLSIWAEGSYNPETEWVFDRGERRQRMREERRRMRDEMETARAAAVEAEVAEQAAREAAGVSGQPPQGDAGAAAASREQVGERPATPASSAGGAGKDAWEQYVGDFCKRYEFSDGQRQSAERFLRAAQRQRDEYRARYTRQFEAAESKLKAAKDDAGRKSAAEELAKLARPMERIFQQLKDRLSKLPTAAQRTKAAQREAAAKPAQKPADKPAPPPGAPGDDE